MKRFFFCAAMVVFCQFITGCTGNEKHDLNENSLQRTSLKEPDTARYKTVITVNMAGDTAYSIVGMQHAPLVLIVKNLSSPTAAVIVGIYGAKNRFLDVSDQLKQYRFNPNDTDLTAQITDLEYGDFAMAIYQDINDDGKINRNFIGIPIEPYAFSNNYKPVLRAPCFKDCKFTYTEKSDTIRISMLKRK